MSGVNPEKFTDKTNEIISAAHSLALESAHVQLAPVHIALALLADADGLSKNIITKAGVEPQEVERKLRRLLVKIPVQEPAPAEVHPNQATLKGKSHQQITTYRV